jgi:hypothetical protein
MGAINGENLELLCFDASHPTCGVGRFAVGGRHVWIPKGGESRFSFRELVDGT